MRGVVDFLEEADVPLDHILGHVGSTEDSAQHLVVNICTECFLDRRDPLPVRLGDARGVEYCKRSNSSRLPVTDAFNGVVDRGINMRANQVDTDLAAAFKRHL